MSRLFSQSRSPRASAPSQGRWRWLPMLVALGIGTPQLLTLGCMTQRAAVSMRVKIGKKTPPDASVKIDEQFIGLLGHVAHRGVRLPEGEHRITVEREGYFPWDRIVVSDRKPIHIEVDLRPIPD